jgi:hypothetical protein
MENNQIMAGNPAFHFFIITSCTCARPPVEFGAQNFEKETRLKPGRTWSGKNRSNFLEPSDVSSEGGKKGPVTEPSQSDMESHCVTF